MDVKATLETRHSEKSGNDYRVIVIKLTPNYEKLVFLDKAEIELLNTINNSKKTFPDKPFWSDDEANSLN